MLDTGAVEKLTQRLGRELLERIEAARTKDYAEMISADPLLNWTRRGPAFLAKVLRFADVYPLIRSDEELMEYLREYLGEERLAPELPSEDAASVRALIAQLHGRFVAGETIADAAKFYGEFDAANFRYTFDLLGEAVTSEREAEQYLQDYIALIQATFAASEAPEMASAVHDMSHHGAVPRLNFSIKLSSLYSRLDPIDQQGSFDGAAPRLRTLFRCAREHSASINVDMEQYQLKELTLDLFKKVLMEDEFRGWPDVSITIQTYLRGNRDDLAALAEWAIARGTPINVRLVKGAYWEHEVQQASYRNWPSPVYMVKSQTDHDFEQAIRFALERHDAFRVAVAGHNARSAAYAMAVAEQLGLPSDCVEYQTLYGLGGELSEALAAKGMRVRVYTPFGKMVPAMAYVARRVLEVGSKAGFLQQMSTEPLPAEKLLAPPEVVSIAEKMSRRPEIEEPFRNEPTTDFSQRGMREQMAQAVSSVRAKLGVAYQLQINGSAESGREELDVMNPSAKSDVIGRVALASKAQAGKAVRAAQKAFDDWSKTPAVERAKTFLRAAEIMREKRFELAAWEIFETAKPWREADADVAEAIDYLEYYSREMVRLAKPRRRDVHGEENEYFYEPRGVAVAITPWNFPLAILTGVTTAAAVAGNAVIMKPAEQSSIVAAKLIEIFTEAGLPKGVIQYLPGHGEEIGEYLVRHPGVQVIGFTGSLAVGLRIQSLAAKPRRGQRELKRVIAEMGGKNAIIIDRDADLDQAVPGVVISAFGYQGQKCSACSRAIVHRDVYDNFLDRLVESVRSLPIGPAEDPHAALGPLISEEALARVRRYMDEARRSGGVVYEGRAEAAECILLRQGFGGQGMQNGRQVQSAKCKVQNEQQGKAITAPSTLLRTSEGGCATPATAEYRRQKWTETAGFYVAPMIVAEVARDSRVATEEVFGPLLCVFRAEDIDDALALANSSHFGLTGGIYSRRPSHIARARAEMRAGNVYVNRPITGAWVDRQPFGGIGMSGIGSKAGGPDYLLQFMQPKTFTENTVRRGFSIPPNE